MSFLAKVAALRKAFRVPDDLPLPVAVCGMSQSMGLPYKIDIHPLVKQVDALMEVTGLVIGGEPAGAPAGAAAPARPSSDAASSPAARATVASEEQPQACGSAAPPASSKAARTPAAAAHAAAPKAPGTSSTPIKQSKLFDMKGSQKIYLPKEIVQRESAKQPAMPYAELECCIVQRYGRMTGADDALPTEAEPDAPKKAVVCPECGKVCANPGALASHRLTHPRDQPAVATIKVVRPKPLAFELSLKLSVDASGCVAPTFLYDGMTWQQRESEREAADAEHAKAKAEREAEQSRRQNQRRHRREAEEAIDHVEQRCGSAKRGTYAACRL